MKKLKIETIVLTERNRDLFLELLRNPPKPNEKMIELMSGRYAKRKGIHIKEVDGS